MLNKTLLIRFVAELNAKAELPNSDTARQIELMRIAMGNPKRLIRFSIYKNPAMNRDIEVQKSLVQVGVMEFMERKGNGGKAAVSHTEIYRLTEIGCGMVNKAIKEPVEG